MILADRLHCTGCSSCAQKCPKNAISMLPDKEGFLQPVVDDTKCIKCGLCEKTCPVLNGNTESKNQYTTTAFAAINNNEEIRMESSSGGIFTILAEKTIEECGVVFGAKFDENKRVIHSYTEIKCGLKDFRGSKYVQSDIGNAYKECEEFLENGRKVLFTGTPCQIGGLRAFLKKDYENLITIDLICHGAPSPLLFEKYVDFRKEQDFKNAAERRIQRIAFRRKDCGWKQFSVAFTYGDATEYCQPLTKDKYMQVFLQDYALRESCYDCPFRKEKRLSDITLADFWGIERVCPEMFDDKGTSLVIINSTRGEETFDKAKNYLTAEKVDIKESLNGNSAFSKKTNRPDIRNSFYEYFIKNGTNKTFKKYGHRPFPYNQKVFVKKCIRKLLGDKIVKTMKRIIRK